MDYEVGRAYYLYDDRAVDGVCKAHVLHVMPHPEREDDRLIVYRWYGIHRRYWWYGVTTVSKQDIWAEYCKEVVVIRKQRRIAAVQKRNAESPSDLCKENSVNN